MAASVSVPGRVNLIGEHIDYHNLSVLPMAIQRRVSTTFDARHDSMICASSQGYADRSFPLTELTPFPAGDWGNYLKAAAKMIARRWTLVRGIDATVTSDLSCAAGLSSSSALLTGFALALLHANGIDPSIGELMELLPEGEQYVGTRGGGMDHAAVLASRAGCALLVDFAPFRFEPIPIPPGWTFLVAHSLTVAEKSGALKAEYNARRTAGMEALRKLGFSSYREALNEPAPDRLAAPLPADQRAAFLHVVSEAKRIESAVTALRSNDIEHFGELLSASHKSLRDRLLVSNPALDELVECAGAAGALGARLTGAGFGGCAIILTRTNNLEQVHSGLLTTFYARRAAFNEEGHLMVATPSTGALGV